MSSIAGKTALVTGASSGIGKSTAALLIEAGVKVYAAARRIDMMKDIEARGAHLIKMDLTDDGSIVSGVNTILAKEGSIDILINNAGSFLYGAIEDVALADARSAFEVNLFGLARLTQLIVPTMRRKGYGKIVNVSSMGGKVYTQFGGWYHASKHALEGFSDCLRMETKPFGVDVIIIEPGLIKTDLGDICARSLKKASGKGAYAASAEKMADGIAKRYSSNALSKPSVIGKVIIKAVSAKNPKTRYIAGYMARVLLFLRHWLSDRIFDKLMITMG